MRKYQDIKTGKVIETNGPISGRRWKEVKPAKPRKTKKPAENDQQGD